MHRLGVCWPPWSCFAVIRGTFFIEKCRAGRSVAHLLAACGHCRCFLPRKMHRLGVCRPPWSHFVAIRGTFFIEKSRAAWSVAHLLGKVGCLPLGCFRSLPVPFATKKHRLGVRWPPWSCFAVIRGTFFIEKSRAGRSVAHLLAA